MRKLLVLGLMILPLLATGCSKAPAEAALKAADEAIAKVQPEAEKYVPEQFKALADAAADAKAKFDQGDYAAVLTAAKDLPAKATEVMTAATAKKDELTKQWTDMQGTLPTMVQGLTEKVTALAAMKRLPKGFDATQLESAKTSLTDVTTMWQTATASFGGGDLMGAMAKAGEVKTKAEELAKTLEAVTVPAMAKK
jgi:hypothetical protein